MVPCSTYLYRPLLTIREACREIAVAHPELVPKGCATCGNRGLCIYEQTERDRIEHLASSSPPLPSPSRLRHRSSKGLLSMRVLVKATRET